MAPFVLCGAVAARAFFVYAAALRIALSLARSLLLLLRCPLLTTLRRGPALPPVFHRLAAPEAGGKRFGLDAIVPPEDPNDGSAEATQTHMYETCAQPAVEDVLKGTLIDTLLLCAPVRARVYGAAEQYCCCVGAPPAKRSRSE